MTREMSTERRAYLRELRGSRQARKRTERDVAAGKSMADRWNAAHAVGTPVTVTLDDGRTIETTTRTPAWALGHGEVVVSVVGITGGYLLSRVAARP